jgi:hypothetical protein
LVRGYSTQFDATSWAAGRALGAPDVWPRYGDLAGAWAPSSRTNLADYLEVMWGHASATRDVDILIEPTLENARRVRDALSAVCWFGWPGEFTPQELLERPVTVIGDIPRADIMLVAWSVHDRNARPDATVFTVEGVEIPTASIDHLIASKRTGRLQDAADIEALEGIRRLRGGGGR